MIAESDGVTVCLEWLDSIASADKDWKEEYVIWLIRLSFSLNW